MNSLKVRYSTLHRCEIHIPEAFFQEHGLTKAYEQHSVKAAQDAMVCTGQDAYGSVVEWAEDSDPKALKEWEAAWRKYLSGGTS